MGEADAVAFCGVAEVAFVVVAEAFVEPLGYSGGVQAGAENAVLHIPCNVSKAVPCVVGEGAGVPVV